MFLTKQTTVDGKARTKRITPRIVNNEGPYERPTSFYSSMMPLPNQVSRLNEEKGSDSDEEYVTDESGGWGPVSQEGGWSSGSQENEDIADNSGCGTDEIYATKYLELLDEKSVLLKHLKFIVTQQILVNEEKIKLLKEK